MAIPVSQVSQTYQDYGVPAKNAEIATVHYKVAAVTAANIVAQTALYAALRLAVDGITLGLEVASTYTAFKFDATGVVSNPLAQRENKWLVRYHDQQNRDYQLEIPTADLSLLDTGTEFLDLTSVPVAAFKTAFEAVVKSPADDTSTTTVDSMQFVGRRN